MSGQNCGDRTSGSPGRVIGAAMWYITRTAVRLSAIAESEAFLMDRLDVRRCLAGRASVMNQVNRKSRRDQSDHVA